MSASNVAFFVGLLRVSLFSKEHYFYVTQEEQATNRRSLRKKLLAALSPEMMDVFSTWETPRRCRLSVMCFYESFQSPFLCRNFAMHLLDLIISIVFPEIEVWSSLVKK